MSSYDDSMRIVESIDALARELERVSVIPSLTETNELLRRIVVVLEYDLAGPLGWDRREGMCLANSPGRHEWLRRSDGVDVCGWCHRACERSHLQEKP